MADTGPSTTTEAWQRFELHEELGRGGMGAVREAFDRRRGEIVALKTLLSVGPRRLLYFKNEFRALAGIVHPNLVRLHELLQIGDEWVLVMERVPGRPLDAWLGPPTLTGSASGSLDAPTFSLEPFATPEPAPSAELTEPVDAAEPDEDALERLRAVLPGIVDGIDAVHQAGYLHCDVKPSNVLIRPDGHPILLDYGLLQPLAGGSSGGSGTVGYMSPEQSQGRECGPPSDWYALGVLIYEVLCGQRPFQGEPSKVLAAKLYQTLPGLPDDAPGDLASLAMALLTPEPEDRPDVRAIRQALGTHTPAPARPLVSVRPRGTDRRLIGREEPLVALEEAAALARDGGRVVLVHGPSGIGKSMLVDTFLRGRTERGDLVLGGRCNERETVRYKGLDAAIDALALALAELDDDQVEPLIPERAELLLRVFPVLGSVRALREHAGETVIGDPDEQRRFLGQALRRLLAGLTGLQPVILSIDDLQWADDESLDLLRAVMRPPESPPILVVATLRSEEDALSRVAPWVGAAVVPGLTLEIGPLSETDAISLARERGLDPLTAKRVAQSSGGVPFFADTLARHVSAGGTGGSLEEVVHAHLGALSESATEVLRAVVVAGRPVAADDLSAVARIQDGFGSALDELLSANLCRRTGTAGADRVECYHDRIRETVEQDLSAEVHRAVHGRFADRLLAIPDADAEIVAHHLELADRDAEAGAHLVAAARDAFQRLAYGHAAELLLRAAAKPGVDAAALEGEIVEALSAAGRGAEAAARLEGSRAQETRIRAAELYIRSGHFDRGLEVAQEVLARAGQRWPKTNLGAIATYLWNRLRIWFRAERFTRPDTPPSTQTLARLDEMWMLGNTIAFVDPLRGSSLLANNLLTALQIGEPMRIGRAFGSEACIAALSGDKERANHLIARGRELHDEAPDGRVEAWLCLSDTIVAFQLGQWEETHRRSVEGVRVLTEKCPELVWERATTDIYRLLAATWLARYDLLAEECGPRIEESRARNDLHTEIHWRLGMSGYYELLGDSLEQGLADVDELWERWPVRADDLPSFYLMTTRVHLLLAMGRIEEAHRLTVDGWPSVKGAMIPSFGLYNSWYLDLRGRCAIGAGDVKDARWVLARLRKEKHALAPGFAEMLESRLLAPTDPTSAAEARMRARDRFDELAMRAHVVAMDLAQAIADGTPTEPHLSRIRSFGTCHPERIVAVLLPGLLPTASAH